MAYSGARGNIKQIRQLAGMRGLMADPQGRDHRPSYQGELPRGPDRSRVLHLHARRPQGHGGHGASYRRLGLPHPSSGRRRAGRHRPRRATAAPAMACDTPVLNDEGRRSTIEPGGPLPCSRTSSPPRRARSCLAAGAYIENKEQLSEFANNGVETVKIRSADDLPCQARRVPEVLRLRPGDGPSGQHRHCRRHHRRPVHRRARHPADDAHVPRRRRRRRGHHPGSVRVSPSFSRRASPRARPCWPRSPAPCRLRATKDSRDPHHQQRGRRGPRVRDVCTCPAACPASPMCAPSRLASS